MIINLIDPIDYLVETEDVGVINNTNLAIYELLRLINSIGIDHRPTIMTAMIFKFIFLRSLTDKSS